MRCVRIAVLTGLLLPGLLVLPTLPRAGADPAPVAPEISTLRPSSIDPEALRALPQQRRAPTPSTPTGRLAVLTPTHLTNEFDVMGVTWSASRTDVQVQVRVRENGAWSAWEHLTATDGGPDPDTAEHRRAKRGTEPLATAGADGVQVQVHTSDGTTPAGLEVALIDAGESPTDRLGSQRTQPLGSADAATAPQIITRRQWGADESLARGPHPVNQTVKAMIVHHTAGSNSYTREGAFQEIRGIYAYHTRSLGWADIGYNLLIDRYGRTFEGRRGSIDLAVRGAHAGGFNTDTYGISVMGSFEAAAVPAAALDAVKRVVGWKLGQYGVDPRGTALLVSKGGGTARYQAGTAVTVATVSGHRDVGQTACPGRNLYAQLSGIRVSAAASAPGTARINWPAFPRDWTGDRDADVLARDRDGYLWSYPGNGVGGFDSRQRIGSGWNGLTTMTQTGDLTGDRRPDIVARHQNGYLYLFEGDGRGRFASSRRLGPGWSGFRAVLGAGDWDSDGNNDLLAVDDSGGMYFYAGNGAGAFRTGRKIGTGWGGLDLVTAVGDFDSGGAADIVARAASGHLYLFRGDGQGGFGATTQLGTGWGAMTAMFGPGDWDGDGKHDLIARAADGSLYLYRGDGLGRLLASRRIGSGWGSYGLIG